MKVSCYFINYKIFVNIVKYKLDLMRKRMEVEERDATSRSSFRCSNCNKQFSDLEADQLFDFISQVTIPLLLLLQQLQQTVSDLEADQLFDFISQVTIPLLLPMQQLQQALLRPRGRSAVRLHITGNNTAPPSAAATVTNSSPIWRQISCSTSSHR